MIIKRFYKHLYSTALFFFTLPAAEATVVRMDFAIGDQSTGQVYIELFDLDAPNTVANFLNYVENDLAERRYDGSFIHRSVRLETAGIDVVQGGGFRLEENLPAAIATDDPLANEFSPLHPNLRGTIAMAKLGGQPDSATSQWFFNVVDNSAALDDTPAPDDEDNGGFTVFGEVLGNGMDTIDAIATVPTENLGGIFTDVPTLNYTRPDPVTDANLVTLLQVIVDPPARIFVDVTDVDFGLVVTNSISDDLVITVQNIGGTDDLAIGTLGDTDAVAPPFVITDDQCSSRTLAQTESCQIRLQFQPTATGSVEESFNIPSSDPLNPDVSVTLRGFGAFNSPTLDVNPASSIDFGDLALADFSEQSLTVRNVGTGSLLMGSPLVSGPDAAEFSVSDDACSGTTLALSESCSITVRLSGAMLGNKSSSLLVTAEPNSQSEQIDMSGNVVASQADLFLPQVNEAGAVELGDTQFDTPITLTVSLTNRGTEDLIFSTISLSGADANQFSLTDNCERLAPGLTCTASLTFTPAGTGSKSAELRVLTNDPDTPLAIIPLTATSSLDGDGVPDAIEAAGANGGDGNLDGIPDTQQQNVTSFLDINGNYVTLEADIGTRLTRVSADQNPAPDTAPRAAGASLRFPNGFFSFVLEDVPIGGAATVTLYLPPNSRKAKSYFKYGWLPGEIPGLTPQHWYQFNFDGNTGAEFLSNRVVLHLVDGGRGDSDTRANGTILDPGGPAVLSAAGGSSSGGGGGCSLSAATNRAAIPVDLIALLLGFVTLAGVRRQRSPRA